MVTWVEPRGDFMHAVKGSSQQEEDASNEVEVVNGPQLQGICISSGQSCQMSGIAVFPDGHVLIMSVI